MRALFQALLIGTVVTSLAVESGVSQSLSQYALIKRKIYINPEIWELNSSVTNQQLGVSLFSSPRSGVYVFDFDFATWSSRSTLLAVVDPDWNRVVYTHMATAETKAFGHFGAGTNQFRWPKSIAAHAISDGYTSENFYDVYVADTYNSRVYRGVYSPPEWLSPMSLTTATVMTGHGLWCPIDVAIDNGQTYRPDTDDKVWVLNGDNTLLNFTYNGTFIRSVALPEGCHATALIHSYWSRMLYVADTANDMIYRYDYSYSQGTYVKGWPEGETSNSIVDIQLDPWGYLWALDASSVITKYDYDLTPLCQYYQSGQLGTCSGFSIALGVAMSCDMYISEPWTSSSGIQHFAIGTDILDLLVTHNVWSSRHQISYTLVDPSLLYAAIYQYHNFGAKIKTLVDSNFTMAGQTGHRWDGTNDLNQQMPTGNYSYRIIATSGYGEAGQPVNQVVKTGDIYHVANCCVGMTGNCDGDPNDNVDIGDLSALQNYLFITFEPLPCMAEGNCDGSTDGNIDASDFTALINHLFITFEPLSDCE